MKMKMYLKKLTLLCNIQNVYYKFKILAFYLKDAPFSKYVKLFKLIEWS
jgi:hypothetical protein